MTWNNLPVELRFRIASQLNISDLSSLSRVSRSWRHFIQRQASRLPKYEISSLHIEQFDFKRFKFIANVRIIRPNKETQMKKFYFRTDNDLWLFLQIVRPNLSLLIQFSSNIPLESSICEACKEVEKLTLNIAPKSTEGKRVNVDYLSRICKGLPKVHTLWLEDMSNDFNEDANEILNKIKVPNTIEVRSEKSGSKLSIGDNTLEYLAQTHKRLDVLALSTDRAKFSLKAVRAFLEKVEFEQNGYLELHYIDCSTNEFFNLLTDMQIPFDGDSIRGIYNSFPVIQKGQKLVINVKYFNDSGNLPTMLF